MHSPQTVARAAPARPKLRTAINKKSRIIFVTPAAIITNKPNFGFSAVTKKLWKTFCNIKNVNDAKLILAYKTQLLSNSPSAPRAVTRGLTKKKPESENSKPPINVA